MSQSVSKIKKLGIIAGQGELPRALVHVCESSGIIPFVVGFKSLCYPDDFQPDVVVRFGMIGNVLLLLKQEGITNLVLIGAVKRPAFWQIFPNLKTLFFFLRLSLSWRGDSALLSAIKKTLLNEGFTLHGVHEFMPELLAGAGVITQVKPTAQEINNIKRGLVESQKIGVADIGQAVIVGAKGDIIGREGRAGTCALIQSCKGIAAAQGGVLVKTCKPQQDLDLDLPTIGVDTVAQAQAAGLSGIAVQAHKTLIVDRDKLITRANEYGLFVTGVEVGEGVHDG